MGDVTPSTKRCSRCLEVLAAAAFNKNRRDRSGLSSRCRACDSEYKREHRAKRLELHREADRVRYKRERERRILASREYHSRPDVRERRRELYRANAASFRAKNRAYRTLNRHRVKEWKRAEYERHSEKIRAYMRAYYAADPARWKAAVLAWARANPETVNERNRRARARKARAAIGVITAPLLAAKAAYWGHRCWICGDVPNTWDHVKPLNKGGPHMLANLRPACWSCNSSKSDRWPFAPAMA